MKILSVLIALALVQAAHAGDSAADAIARRVTMNMAPKAKIDVVEAAPIDGYRQVLVNGRILYVSDDGKYALQGGLFDTEAKRDLTSERLALETKRKIDAVPKAQRIVFAPATKAKYTVTVFTDLDCGYCRKLHSQIADYNERGIEVDYLAYPRSGISTPSYDKAVSVWCAKDRKAAFTSAKSGTDPAPATCDNPVAEEYTLGSSIGVDGTPTVIGADGTKLGSYLTPDEMLQRLQSPRSIFAGR